MRIFAYCKRKHAQICKIHAQNMLNMLKICMIMYLKYAKICIKNMQINVQKCQICNSASHVPGHSCSIPACPTTTGLCKLFIAWILPVRETLACSRQQPTCLPATRCQPASPMLFKSHFKSSFGNVTAKILRLLLSPSLSILRLLPRPQALPAAADLRPQVAQRLGGDDRQVPLADQRQDRLWKGILRIHPRNL